MYDSWTPELEAALAEPFPDECLDVRTQQGRDITTAHWRHYAQRLDECVGVGGWECDVIEVTDTKGRLTFTVPVQVLGVKKVNVGSEDEDKDSWGTPDTNAWAQAFKRSCALFGVGRYLYAKGKPGAPKTKRKEKPVGAGSSAGAPTLPSGDFAGKALSDVPTDYLIPKADEMDGIANRALLDGDEKKKKDAARWAALIRTEIARRGRPPHEGAA